MKFLLKIVQGPNAGAEIALVEGVRVTLGSADTCDIVLADPTLPAEACAIEVSADAVVLTPTGEAPESLEPLRVRSFGSTALAIGPADAPWGALDWEAPVPAAPEPPAEAGEERSESEPPVAEPVAPSTEPAAEDTAGSSGDTAPRSWFRRIVGLVVLLLLLAAAWLLLPRLRALVHPDGQTPSSPEPEAPASSLPDLLSRYGLVSVETNGVTLVRGDFATRAERLAATAALYEAQPGVLLDLVDRDTLLASTADLLAAATDGALTVLDITNRVAILSGRAPDPAFLKATIDALRADVPRLSGTDTASVILDSPLSAPSGNGTQGPLSRPSQRVSAPRTPRLPLCGILLQPYPCLVLQNGQRLAVGSEIGGYKIKRIAPDLITLVNGEEEELEWTP